MRFEKKQIAIALSVVLANAAMAAPSNGNASVRAAEAHLKNKAASFNAAAEDGFAVTDAIVDDSGDQHVRFSRSHRGLPVIGGDLVVHMDSRGGMKSASMTQRVKLNVDTTARISEENAIQYARGLFGGVVQGNITSRLVVHARTDNARLAYEVVVTGETADGSPRETLQNSLSCVLDVSLA